MDQIGWDYRSTLIELRPGDGTAEPFFIHLFRGCVLFESLLKANPKNIPPPTRHTLGRVLQYLHSHLSTPANIDIGGTDFPTVLSDLSAADHSITTAVKFAGKVRNTVGHNLVWKATLEKWQYDLLGQDDLLFMSARHRLSIPVKSDLTSAIQPDETTQRTKKSHRYGLDDR